MRTFEEEQGPKAALSLSGNERNQLFVNTGAGRFFGNASNLSGLDAPQDARAFATLDYDQDGWLDVAVVNANEPLLQLFRNQLAGVPGQAARSIVFRLQGGKRDSVRSPLRPRDGYGALLRIQVGERTLLRELRAGEGLAAQNSAELLVGLGSATGVSGVEVRWPSGKLQQVGELPASTLVTLYEVAEHAPDGSGVQVQPYTRLPAGRFDAKRSGARYAPPLLDGSEAQLRLYTTMATWCSACKRELPRLSRLRSRFSPDQLALFGVPVDTQDSAEKLSEYRREHRPLYRFLGTEGAEHPELKGLLKDMLHGDILPSTLLTDGQGQVLDAFYGVPTVSELRRRLLAPGLGSPAPDRKPGDATDPG